MSKIKDFFEKAAADEAAKKEVEAILVGKKLNEVTDEQFAKLSEIAKKVGIDIAADEMKACLNGSSGELDDDELESVAGGWDELGRPTSLRDWYDLVCQCSKEREDYESVKKIAAEHNISERDLGEAIDLFDYWAAFFY